ncbi:MAG: aldo/keto reductase, partial [Cohnella sp.]|nr:aldo/keto reductase [Cohnella sp.]
VSAEAEVRAAAPERHVRVRAAVEAHLERLVEHRRVAVCRRERQHHLVARAQPLPALRKLAEQGKVRNVGVTGRTLNLLMQYMNTGEFDTVQMYARFSLVDYTAKDALIPLAKERNIGIINSSVLYSGTLADAPLTTANSDIVAMIRERMQQLAFLRQTNEPGGLIEPAMRFSLGNPDIQVTLSGATSPSMIQETMAFCDGNGLGTSTLNKLYALFDGELFS